MATAPVDPPDAFVNDLFAAHPMVGSPPPMAILATLPDRPGIRWMRVVVAGILLEFALVAVLVPIGAVFGAPPGLGRNQTGHYAVFLIAVPVACFVLGYVAGRIVVRRLSGYFVAHGLLVGIVATTFYLVITSLNPQGGLPAAIAGYGTIHFWATQILRIAGCTLAGFGQGTADPASRSLS